MIRVKDREGNIIPGVFKDAKGAVIIKNEIALKQHQKDQQINKLENEVRELKELVHMLLRERNG